MRPHARICVGATINPRHAGGIYLANDLPDISGWIRRRNDLGHRSLGAASARDIPSVLGRRANVDRSHGSGLRPVVCTCSVCVAEGSQMREPSNNTFERTVMHRGPRLSAARSSWSAAQLSR